MLQLRHRLKKSHPQTNAHRQEGINFPKTALKIPLRQTNLRTNIQHSIWKALKVIANLKHIFRVSKVNSFVDGPLKPCHEPATSFMIGGGEGNRERRDTGCMDAREAQKIAKVVSQKKKKSSNLRWERHEEGWKKLWRKDSYVNSSKPANKI